MKVLAIVQARLTSSRFPKKILKEIKGKSLIEILISRLKLSTKIDRIIVAIPKNNKEHILKSKLKKLNIQVFEGSENNVLDRYYKASKLFN